MNEVVFGPRTLRVLSPAEARRFKAPDSLYAALVSVDDIGQTVQEAVAVIRPFLTPQCAEIQCTGSHAGDMHDALDYVIEDLGLGIVTSTAKDDETPDDVCFYFLEVAGGKPPLLLAVVGETSQMHAYLEKAARAAGRKLEF